MLSMSWQQNYNFSINHFLQIDLNTGKAAVGVFSNDLRSKGVGVGKQSSAGNPVQGVHPHPVES